MLATLRRMKLLLLACAVALSACGSSATPSPDSGPAPGTFGAACVTASDTSTECTSGVCTNTFDMIGHPVCSAKCTFGNDTTCPTGSTGQKCNMKGYCKP